jgi:FKBP-type peptidyl-prolyl cis-trans isomerase
MRISLLPVPILIIAALAQGDDPTDDPVDLQIDVTRAVQCDRRSQMGDVISVNYRGTFTNGTEFDSSTCQHRLILQTASRSDKE